MTRVEQLTQMMIANFDSDRSGALESNKLQNAVLAFEYIESGPENDSGGHRDFGKFRGGSQAEF